LKKVPKDRTYDKFFGNSALIEERLPLDEDSRELTSLGGIETGLITRSRDLQEVEGDNGRRSTSGVTSLPAGDLRVPL